MKYLKKYEDVQSENLLEQVFSDCKIFIEDLKKCDKGNFLVRGVNNWNLEDYNINLFELNTTNNRKPSDMPLKVHNKLNYLFNEKFGWNVRNGLFSFGRNFYSPNDKNNKEQMESGYGNQSYLLFPCGEYDIVWSETIDDLYSSLDDDYLDIGSLIPNEYLATELYNELYEENKNGQWTLNDQETGKSDKTDAAKYVADNWKDFDFKWDETEFETEEEFKETVEGDVYYKLSWEPEVNWFDYWYEYVENWEDNFIEQLDFNLIDDDYKEGNLNDAINSHNEVCMNCKKYYLINQKYTEKIINLIWE
jgi:hypothetical protein